MIIRVLIINRQLVFAVTIKQALEQTGAFEVHPFTDPNAAMDYLRTHPHDVALVDFAVKVMAGPEIVKRLREIQPELAVIVSPMQPDSAQVIRDLRLQGMIDAPFSARGIIPLIEHAVEQMSQPTQAITRSLVEPEEPGIGDTEILGRTEPGEPRPLPLRGQQVHTRILDDEDDSPPDQPNTRILNDEPENLPQTRNLGRVERAQTRILDDEPENLPQPPLPSRRDQVETRILDDEPGDWPQPRVLDAELKRPPSLPEFSSLNDILSDEAPSSLFEPPVRDGDTPAVPNVDSDAVRQFLATGSSSTDRLFDRMLTEIKPEDTELPAPPQLPGGDFENLVNSMRGEQQHTPLPDRHQQFVEFILTGGMDSLLSEIEKAKTGPLDEDDVPAEPPPRKPLPAPTTFEKLAAEEPPPPALEEGGTVSDLMVGVSDTSFRNVLAMMRGDELLDSDVDLPPAPSRQEIEAAYAAFFEQEVAAEDSDDHLPVPVEPEAGDEPPAITAQLILETALDESTPVDSFSLDDVIGTIERQLAQHQPQIKPLPSWQIKSIKPIEPPAPPKPPEQEQAPRGIRRIERYIKEPDFLPEEFPEQTEQPAAEDLPEPVSETVWEMMRQAHEPHLSLEEALLMDDLEAAVEDESEQVEYQWRDDDETILGAAFESAVPEEAAQPETLPEQEVALDLPDTLPGDLWDDLAQPDWEAESDWDSEPPAEAVTPPPVLPGFDDDWELTVDEAPEDETVFMDRPHLADEPVALGAAADFEPQAAAFDVQESDDPYIAQIALSLTQVSLELAAEATLLTNEEQIVAFAGHLAQADVEELRATVADDWNANSNEARIRFVTLPGSGKDYMLYSRKTVNNLTLTMIFSGMTALRDIRRQGRRLMEALESVPEISAEAMPEALPELATLTGEMPAVEPAPVVTVQPFTYLWLLRDPNTSLDERTERAIVAGLGLQLGEMGWLVKSLRARSEYVYVHAEVPGERPAYEVIDELKRRAGEIAHAQEPGLQPDSLWADSYLVMMPGRELDPDEIDQFINFERMA